MNVSRARFAGVGAREECGHVRVLGLSVVVCVLLAVLVSCGGTTDDEVTPTPTVAATAQPSPTAQAVADAESTTTPTPAPAAASKSAEEAAPEGATPVPPTQAQSILFYDLTEIEKTCPGYQEFTGFRQTVSQVKITCTGPGVETVYFVDLDNLVVTGIRVPLLEPEIP